MPMLVSLVALSIDLSKENLHGELHGSRRVRGAKSGDVLGSDMGHGLVSALRRLKYKDPIALHAPMRARGGERGLDGWTRIRLSGKGS